MVDRESCATINALHPLIRYRMTLVLATWFISARHWFKGPVINVEVCSFHIPLSRVKLTILAYYTRIWIAA